MVFTRPYNFSAGPAALPESVLRHAAGEMLNWVDANGKHSGMGVMEMSHRGKEFGEIFETAQADLRELLAVPPHFKTLFLQGGGLGENAIVPLNLAQSGVVDFVVTGSWSEKSANEAQRFCQPHIAAHTGSGIAGDKFTTLPTPSSWQLSETASYVHVCSNETIHGVEFHELPDLASLGVDAAKTPLVLDASSHILSRPIDWSRVGVVFAGAQKNIGPAGLVLVFVREDLLGRAVPQCPSVFDYTQQAAHGSMLNTPPTYAIYMAGLVFKHLKALGGVATVEQQNIAKAQLLYDYLDGSSFYYNPVAKDARSRMNVPFFLRDESRNEAFLAGAKAAGLLQLKGHKSVGGMRASIYNAMPLAGVQALVAYLREFARTT